MSKIAMFLWFDDKAEEAADFYVSTFREFGQSATIDAGFHGHDSGQRPKRAATAVTFTLAGQNFIAFNGGPHFTFSPAISLVVKCASQAEVDGFWNRLLEGGKPERCGWLTDKFGLTWQIVPEVLGEMLNDPDAARAERVKQAMLQMIKLDIETLTKAHAGPVAVRV